MKKRTGNDRWLILLIIELVSKFVGAILIIISCCVQGEAGEILLLIGAMLVVFGLGILLSIFALGNYVSDEKVKEDKK